jgi:adenylyltransferase/sulfurtransferase
MEEINRFLKYERQIILPNFGIEAQQKIAAAKVLVIGAGGLGCPVILYLAASGIGNIGIAESDVVSLSNLHRQIIYSENQVGKPKAEALQEKLSDYKFQFHEAITTENVLSIFTHYDIIVDTTDNFATRYLVNDACVLLDKILVSASIHQFQSQLSVYNYPISAIERSATYRCLFPESSSIKNCAEDGVLPTIAGIAGTMQANEVIKIVTGLGNVMYNKLVLVNGLTLQQNIIEFAKDEQAVQQLKLNGLATNYVADFYCETSNSELEINANELNQILIQHPESIVLIDVREDWEHQQFNIGGQNLQTNDLLKQPNIFNTSKQIILYCKIGERSKIAQQRLIEKYKCTNIYNLKGGVVAWQKMIVV